MIAGASTSTTGSAASSIDALEEGLGHRFGRPELLTRALSHASIGAQSNERLEFLGDSVLSILVSTELFERFSTYPEGKLTSLRSAGVRRDL